MLFHLSLVIVWVCVYVCMFMCVLRSSQIFVIVECMDKVNMIYEYGEHERKSDVHFLQMLPKFVSIGRKFLPLKFQPEKSLNHRHTTEQSHPYPILSAFFIIYYLNIFDVLYDIIHMCMNNLAIIHVITPSKNPYTSVGCISISTNK